MIYVALYIIGCLTTVVILSNFFSFNNDDLGCTATFCSVGSVFWPIGLPIGLFWAFAKHLTKNTKEGWLTDSIKQGFCYCIDSATRARNLKSKLQESITYIDTLEEKFKDIERRVR